MASSAATSRPARNWLLRFWLPLGLVVAAADACYAVWRVGVGHADLLCFHYTSRHWLETGEFTREFGVRHYVPAFVVMITPLVAWPPRVTAALWAGLSLVLLVLSVREVGRQLARSLDTPLPGGLRWVWPIVLVLPFAADTIALGQVNILVLWLCLLALRQLTHHKDARAGLTIAIAGIVKLYPLLLVLPLLLKLRYRAAISAAAGFILLAGGLSLAAFGWRGSIDAHRQWLSEIRGGDASEAHLIFRNGPSEFLRHNNQSLAAVIRRWTTVVDTGGRSVQPPINLSLPQAKAIYAAAAAALLLFLAWTTWRCRKETLSLAEWSAWLAGVVAFVPIYWTHYFVLLLPALALLAASVWYAWLRDSADVLGTALLIAWMTGLPLLAFAPVRWFGLHCWLAVALTFWTALRAQSEPRAQATGFPVIRTHNASPMHSTKRARDHHDRGL
jgi:hypothetical protein